MLKIFNIPDDIVAYFFNCIAETGKYRIEQIKDKIIINPRLEQEYYKPQIIVNDISKLKDALNNYVKTLDSFYSHFSSILKPYHDLNYFLNILLFNMTNTDASDLADYINKYSKSFDVDIFSNYSETKHIMNIDDSKFYAQRVLENPGLETPFCMIFQMQENDKTYQLPLVRYAIDNDTCYIYAVQMGRGRAFNYQDHEYKKTINKLNTKLKDYRDVPPNFVLSLSLFLKILNEQNINNILIPDYLFGRYRKYHGASTVVRSDDILSRILNRFMHLLIRMDIQIDGFDILSYPNDVDSFMRIKLNNLRSDNEMLNEMFHSKLLVKTR